MKETVKTSYVLGTESYEIERLKLQHGIWRANTTTTWKKAGITQGSRVIDVGAGPGFATLDLSEFVGSNGHVAALERSRNYLDHLKTSLIEQGLDNVSVYDMDLVTDEIPVRGYDASWCRWVCCFLSNPDALIAKLGSALRTGGTAVFYEYIDYGSWRMLPHEPMVEQFVGRVMQSWRASGGEPDVAPRVVGALQNHGFDVVSVTPKVFGVKPGDDFWTWIASYMRVNTHRSLALGEIDANWAQAFIAMLDKAEQNGDRFMTTPMVLEIIATNKN